MSMQARIRRLEKIGMPTIARAGCMTPWRAQTIFSLQKHPLDLGHTNAILACLVFRCVVLGEGRADEFCQEERCGSRSLRRMGHATQHLNVPPYSNSSD